MKESITGVYSSNLKLNNMEQKKEKAEKIRRLVSELNQAVREAQKTGLIVEIRPAFGGSTKDDAIMCRIGEYIPF